MDLREFMQKCEAEGDLKRIKTEVDWNLELSHIAKLNEEKKGPALLFENVKGYKTPVITSTCTTTERLALIMGMPKQTSLVELMREWVKKGPKTLRPVGPTLGPTGFSSWKRISWGPNSSGASTPISCSRNTRP